MSPERTLNRRHFPTTKIEKGVIFVESERETNDWCAFDTKGEAKDQRRRHEQEQVELP